MTGDIGRYLPDGNIEFLGRTDDQMKIRGSGSSSARSNPCCGNTKPFERLWSRSGKMFRGQAAGGLYYSGRRANSLRWVLRQHLKEKLPEYMVPNAFMMVEKFPLTRAAKWTAGPSNTRTHTAELEQTYVAPRTPVEQSLAEIWAKVLGVERVGVNDNFFELGGIRPGGAALRPHPQVAGVDLPLASLFRSPTVRALASFSIPILLRPPFWETRSEISSPLQQWQCLVPYSRKATAPCFSYSCVWRQSALLSQPALLPGPDQPVHGLQARASTGCCPSYFHRGNGQPLYHWNSLCSVFRAVFSWWASFGGTVAFEIAQQLTQEGEKVAFLALLDSVGPGSRGYRHWRTSLKMRLSRTGGDDLARQTPLFLYLCKRILRYLSNRIRILRCAFFRLTKRPIPLELRETYLVRSHNKALKRYMPQQYLGPITLFRALLEMNGLAMIQNLAGKTSPEETQDYNHSGPSSCLRRIC